MTIQQLGRGARRRGVLAVWCAAAWLALAHPVAAQQPSSVDSLRAEVARLRAIVDSLRAADSARAAARHDSAASAAGAAPAAKAAADTTDPLAAIRAAAAAAAGGGDTTTKPVEAAQPGQFVGRQRMLTQFNPEISVTGDIFALMDSRDADNDNFIPREFELALQSNLDPYSRAKIFIAHHEPGGELIPFGANEQPEDPGVEVEEGYVEWVSLPGGLSVDVGRFRQRFGTLNRWHQHALPGQELPLPYLAFFGVDGLAQTGISVHWLTPLHFGTHELWGELTRGENDMLFGDSHRVSGLVHLNNFWQLDRSTYVEVGLSGLAGSHSGPLPEDEWNARMGGVDFAVDWRPPERASYRELVVRGAVMTNRRRFDDAPDVNAWGGFLLSEMRYSTRGYVGLRYEYTENPADPSQHASLVAPTLTWWQSEFVRLRAEYDFLQRPFAGGRDLHQLVLQATFAMGPHKHDTY
ncbi:MAG TPA: hypothetical protein VFK13_08365 [Gemmatimonadaceae bacterium]|nr:hypothetical protein [Gemmatimonadaceae bacterium]